MNGRPGFVFRGTLSSSSDAAPSDASYRKCTFLELKTTPPSRSRDTQAIEARMHNMTTATNLVPIRTASHSPFLSFFTPSHSLSPALFFSKHYSSPLSLL